LQHNFNIHEQRRSVGWYYVTPTLRRGSMML
jgi:hypothetical protein